MWTLDQVEEAFQLFRKASPETKLDVWFCDRGLCVFKAPSPSDFVRSRPELMDRLHALNWSWEGDGHEFGEPCWYLFRSD